MLLAAARPLGSFSRSGATQQGQGCFVRDANGDSYLDLACKFQEVFKFDSTDNSVTLLHYQDHGQLPPDAALPGKAVQFILHVDCNCIYDGDYLETITPSGEYHSHGPLNSKAVPAAKGKK